MTKSLFLLVMILTGLLTSCGKKLEDTDKKDGNNDTRVGVNDSAINKARKYLLNAIKSNDRSIVKSALDRIDNLNFYFSNGETPLTEAIKFSKSEIVIDIIDMSNIINVENKFNETPANLIITTKALEKSEKRDIFKKLLTLNLDINKKGINGTTAIEKAIDSKNEVIAMLLMRKGAKTSIAFTKADLIYLSKKNNLRRAHKLLLEISNAGSSSPLSMLTAIRNSQRNLVEYLVNTNPRSAQIINDKDLLTETLKIESMGDRINILSYLLSVKGVKADGNSTDKTPLIYAASQFQSSHKNSIAYLIKAGANFYHKDRKGYTAIDYAARNLNVKNVNYLYNRLLSMARDTFNTPGSKASRAILSACRKTPSKKVAERILWNGKKKRSSILRKLRCPSD